MKAKIYFLKQINAFYLATAADIKNMNIALYCITILSLFYVDAEPARSYYGTYIVC